MKKYLLLLLIGGITLVSVQNVMADSCAKYSGYSAIHPNTAIAQDMDTTENEPTLKALKWKAGIALSLSIASIVLVVVGLVILGGPFNVLNLLWLSAVPGFLTSILGVGMAIRILGKYKKSKLSKGVKRALFWAILLGFLANAFHSVILTLFLFAILIFGG